MLTTDSIYKKPLLPVITIKNTANNATLYTYSSFTGAATGITNAFPLYCSVNLSQKTQGEFTIQFEDPNRTLENTITVNSRVFIDCGKQSTSLTRLISGLVRKKGYNRGGDDKILYTITGSSTAIRLNELIRYVVSEAAKTADGITPDKTDVSRKADTLLAANLGRLTADGILSISNLAANSDVETFVASLSIEYGQLQDIVTYIEQQSGGEVVVDQNDLVNFRYEIKNNLTGRGFTIKNSRDNEANDDANDTMYLVNKNWTYEDDFYSSNYSNKVTAIMRADPRPSAPLDLGFVTTNSFAISTTNEYAVKFRPTHTRITPGDIYVVGAHWCSFGGEAVPEEITLLVCNDAGGGVPVNTNGIVGAYTYFRSNFDYPLQTANDIGSFKLMNDGYTTKVLDGSLFTGDFYLDTTRDYWLIFQRLVGSLHQFTLGANIYATVSPNIVVHHSGFADIANGGSGWASTSIGLPCFQIGRYRSTPYTVWDPKAMNSIQSGFSAGQPIESMVTETAVQITTRDSMVRHLASELYARSKPTTTYNFPSVLAPNIPPFPGDPIIISDTVLGLSTAGNQIALTTCGDMSYQWGSMASGSYEAPTKLSIQAVQTPPRYR